MIFSQSRDAVRLAWQRIEFWRARFPSPQPLYSSHPESAFAVFEQTDHAVAQTAILAEALDAAIVNRAKLPRRRKRRRTSPYRAVTILEELHDFLSGKLRVLSQPPVLPTGQSFTSTDPKSAIARGEQAGNLAGGEMLIRWRLPEDSSDPIEANEGVLSSQPEIAVGRLGNRGDGAFGKALADLPRRVRVLADVERRIQRERTRAPRQQQPAISTASARLRRRRGTRFITRTSYQLRMYALVRKVKRKKCAALGWTMALKTHSPSTPANVSWAMHAQIRFTVDPLRVRRR